MVQDGTYNDRAKAARVADRAALVVFGENTALNLPDQITMDERRALSAIQDVAAYAKECRKHRAATSAQLSEPDEYVGFTLTPDREFKAKIKINGKNCLLGNFDRFEDAAIAWDEAAVVADLYVPKKRGGVRELNFPAKGEVRFLANLHPVD
jgi:hypothetical protein